MTTANILTFNYDVAIPQLQVLSDTIAHKIILSTIDSSKTAQEIALENGLPISSTYKKIRKLCDFELLCIDRVSLDEYGKKVLYYRSRVKSLEFCLRAGGSSLHLERNESACNSKVR